MTFRVQLLPAADEELAAIFIETLLRDDVFQAALRLEEMLRTDADQLGESRSDGIRIIFVPPLGATFHVDLANRQVTVLRIWYYA